MPFSVQFHSSAKSCVLVWITESSLGRCKWPHGGHLLQSALFLNDAWFYQLPLFFCGFTECQGKRTYIHRINFKSMFHFPSKCLLSPLLSYDSIVNPFFLWYSCVIFFVVKNVNPAVNQTQRPIIVTLSILFFHALFSDYFYLLCLFCWRWGNCRTG